MLDSDSNPTAIDASAGNFTLNDGVDVAAHFVRFLSFDACICLHPVDMTLPYACEERNNKMRSRLTFFIPD